MKGKHPDYTVSTVVSTGGSELARECHQDTQLVPDLTVSSSSPPKMNRVRKMQRSHSDDGCART